MCVDRFFRNVHRQLGLQKMKDESQFKKTASQLLEIIETVTSNTKHIKES